MLGYECIIFVMTSIKNILTYNRFYNRKNILCHQWFNDIVIKRKCKRSVKKKCNY